MAERDAPPTARSVAGELGVWIDRLFPDAERGERLKGALARRFGCDERPLSAEVCREVEAVAQEFARHLELEFFEDGGLTPDEEAPGWPPQDPAEVRARAAQVREVVRRADGIGVLVLAGLDPTDVAAPYLEAAFALVRGARGVVLDLRDNRGGEPGTVALVLDWLCGPVATHISDVMSRQRTQQWWTPGRPREEALPSATPVAALIGPVTYSSGEALAYHLQSRRLATLVGEATPGAADHVTPVRLDGHVRALVPYAVVRDAVTHGNWEGTGVRPDVPCPQSGALEAAVRLLLRRA